MLNLATENLEEVANLMREPGAFAWWYADLIDAEGRGVVLIGSFGLPFLPGSRARPRPVDRPSLAIALYDRDRTIFYALQTFEPDEASLGSSGCMRLGRSRIDLRLADGVARLDAAIDVDVPGGGRMVGRIQARGPRSITLETSKAGSDGSTHRWAPILAAQSGRARFELDDGLTFSVDGRIYVDSNGSSQPLHELGIADWRWGRVAFPDREIIYYFVDPLPDAEGTAPIRHVLEARPDGRLIAHDALATWRQPRRSVYGLGYDRELALASAEGLDVRLTMRALVDDGPFYLRFLVDAEDAASGAPGRGFAERVVPDRVDRPWQRPFVRMRTFASQGDNSMWLPLFTGPRRGRLERLLNHWRSAPTSEVSP